MKLSDLAASLGGTVEGDGDIEITDICQIQNGKANAISFLAHPRYNRHLADTKASAVFVREDVTMESPAVLVRVKNPYLSFVRATHHFYAQPVPFEPGIHPTAVIDESAEIGENAAIGPHVFIGPRTKIGKNALIYPNCVIMEDVIIGDELRMYSNVSIRENVHIGDRAIIHGNTTIGSDGFGFAPNPPEGYEKILQIGGVRIGDDVEIQANTSIDRGAIGHTKIGNGCKIDNQVQIAHGVEMGDHNVIAGCSGLAGSVKMGQWNAIGGMTGFANHINVGNFNQVAVKSGMMQDLKDNEIVAGYPAFDLMQFKRIVAVTRKLPDLDKEVRALRKELNELRKATESGTDE